MPLLALAVFLMVEARVLEVRGDGPQTVITILFDALTREDRQASQPSRVREFRRIRRDESASKSKWVLEGIQQLEIESPVGREGTFSRPLRTPWSPFATLSATFRAIIDTVARKQE